MTEGNDILIICRGTGITRSNDIIKISRRLSKSQVFIRIKLWVMRFDILIYHDRYYQGLVILSKYQGGYQNLKSLLGSSYG